VVTNPAINPTIVVSSLIFGNSFQRSRRNSIFQHSLMANTLMCSPLQLPFQPPSGDQDYTNIDGILMVICRRIFRRVCRRDNAGVNALRSVRLDV
jgi:hypothetical protein